MRKNTLLPAFTLAELLVGMTIIAILALGISNFNFSRLSQKQKISIEATKIINRIEEARNNALIGKGVGTNLVSPESWSVTLENTNSSGSLEVKYLSGSVIEYDSWSASNPFSIFNMKCEQLDGTSDDVSDVTLTFTGSLGGIRGINNNDCDDDNYKKLSFDFGTQDMSQHITINTLSGVIEID